MSRHAAPQRSAAAPPTPLDRSVLASPGRPIDPRTRSVMERALGTERGFVAPFRSGLALTRAPAGGEDRADQAVHRLFPLRPAGRRHDFSGVRVHSDSGANASAQAHGAAAYAIGNRIVFGAGRYRPETPAGSRLLAHELAHLLHQGADGRQSLECFEAGKHEAAERSGLAMAGFSSEEASAAYFGNWMRDMNQLFVPMLVKMLPVDVIFSLIAYQAAKKFGRELTPEQFGYYIPAEHLDNPAGLVKQDDLLASQPAVSKSAQAEFPGRLTTVRPPNLKTPQDDVAPGSKVGGQDLFAVDQTGMMAFLRRSNIHVERRLELAAAAGRTPDGLHHLGAALHAVEDLFAHSNFVEIAVGKLLAQKGGKFLEGVVEGEDRKLFTYSAMAKVKTADGKGTEMRPVLTTGSFTGADTKVSLASELAGILSHPPDPPATDVERAAMRRLTLAIIRNFEQRLRNDKAFRQSIADGAKKLGIPAVIADHLDKAPLSTMYEIGGYFAFLIPEAQRMAFTRMMDVLIFNRVMQPAAGVVQAMALETQVKDTSLINFLRESQEQEQGKFTARDEVTMKLLGRVTGESVAQQKAASVGSAKRHAAALKATPAHVVAGPSHSQIAKDHANSPFFGLAFRLATEAVKRLARAMLAAWAERGGGPTKPVEFSPGKFPGPAPKSASTAEQESYAQAGKLFDEGATARLIKDTGSLIEGASILKQGGGSGLLGPAASRKAAAHRIRTVAVALDWLTQGPAAAAKGILALKGLADAVAPRIAAKFAGQIAGALAAAKKAGTGPTVTELKALASGLRAAAAKIEGARRHADREAANAALVAERAAAVHAVAGNPSVPKATAVALLYVLDEEIQATAVAYSSEQRNVLEGKATIPELGPQPAELVGVDVAMPAITGSPKTVALMEEARRVMSHPYQHNWWEPVVRAYASAHPEQLASDIEARNEGVTFYRSSGDHPNPAHD